jgi:pimeloyl-ACP methyl ester carboxylesterase
MPTADVRGLPVHYEEDGDGPPVLFCHGFLMDRTMFDPQVESLAPGYRCIRMDERGFGGTPVDGPFDYWDLADDAAGLLDRLDVDEAVWVGMSQGGFLALRAALAHSDRVRGLVLIDTDAAVDDPATREGYREMFRTWFEHGPVDPLVEEVAGLILGGDEQLRRTWIERWREIPPERLRRPAECLLERDDVSGRLDEIDAPALVIHGTEDRAIPMDRAEALERGLPNSEGLLRVEGAAHAPNLTHPEVVNPRLRSFLEAHA